MTKKSLLCILGIHKWKTIGVSSLGVMHHLGIVGTERCERCKEMRGF